MVRMSIESRGGLEKAREIFKKEIAHWSGKIDYSREPIKIAMATAIRKSVSWWVIEEVLNNMVPADFIEGISGAKRVSEGWQALDTLKGNMKLIACEKENAEIAKLLSFSGVKYDEWMLIVHPKLDCYASLKNTSAGVRDYYDALEMFEVMLFDGLISSRLLRPKFWHDFLVQLFADEIGSKPTEGGKLMQKEIRYPKKKDASNNEQDTQPQKRVWSTPAEYEGIIYPSTTEARWAVFFDACDVRWLHEPHNFEDETGLRYLPDFYVRDVEIELSRAWEDDSGEYHPAIVVTRNLWVEVKGRMTEYDIRKIKMAIGDFVGEETNDDEWLPRLREEPLTVVGDFPRGSSVNAMMSDISPNLDLAKDGLLTTDTELEQQKMLCVTKEGKLRLCIAGYDNPDISEYATLAVYKVARNAKFWFGQTPTRDSVRFTARDALTTEALGEI